LPRPLARRQPRREALRRDLFPEWRPELWEAASAGVGKQWQLSSVLEPFSALNRRRPVISNLEMAPVFNATGSSSWSRHTAGCRPWLTCTDAAVIRKKLNVPARTAFRRIRSCRSTPCLPQDADPSLQSGYRPLNSYWTVIHARSAAHLLADRDQAMYKLVVSDRGVHLLVGAGPVPGDPSASSRDVDARKSVARRHLGVERRGRASKLSAQDSLAPG